MSEFALRDFHAGLNATFLDLSGRQAVAHYGNARAEHSILVDSVGVADLSFRSRLCLTGADRLRFLNGQVTNNLQTLAVGQGAYAALVTAKGKMVSDLYVYILENEILLDFEPGLTDIVAKRLEGYIIADDVQVVDVSPHYGLLTVQGPQAAQALQRYLPNLTPPSARLGFVTLNEDSLGEIYVMNHARASSSGWDLFVPRDSLPMVFDGLLQAARPLGGGACGWQALEVARIESGVPRFGADMDETNLPPEAGIEQTAISYNKGCYIGQEIIARIRTYGQVARALRGLRLADDLPSMPVKGAKLFKDGKEVGFITSATSSPSLHLNVALGYVRREANKVGTALALRMGDIESSATIVELPFKPESGA